MWRAGFWQGAGERSRRPARRWPPGWGWSAGAHGRRRGDRPGAVRNRNGPDVLRGLLLFDGGRTRGGGGRGRVRSAHRGRLHRRSRDRVLGYGVTSPAGSASATVAFTLLAVLVGCLSRRHPPLFPSSPSPPSPRLTRPPGKGPRRGFASTWDGRSAGRRSPGDRRVRPPAGDVSRQRQLGHQADAQPLARVRQHQRDAGDVDGRQRADAQAAEYLVQNPPALAARRPGAAAARAPAARGSAARGPRLRARPRRSAGGRAGRRRGRARGRVLTSATSTWPSATRRAASIELVVVISKRSGTASANSRRSTGSSSASPR